MIETLRGAAVRRMGPMLVSGQGLLTGKAAAMGLGFVFWFLAARLFDPRDVGLAAGAVSSVLLAVSLGTLGVGAAYTLAYPRADAKGVLLGSATAVVVGSGLVVSAGFVVVAGVGLDELQVVASSPAFAAVFVAVGAVGTLQALLDRVSMARHQGTAIILRNVVNGVVTILPLAVVLVATGGIGAFELFVFWCVGTLAGTLVAWWQVTRPPSALGGGWSVDRRMMRDLVGVGRSHYLLGLSQRSPTYLFPVLVTELISATANAYWYPVGMIAWATYLIPVSLSAALFAEGSHAPESIPSGIKRTALASLALGGVAIVFVWFAGPYVLRLFGEGYGAEGSAPLRVMVLALVPLTALYMYVDVCRAVGRLREAIVTSVLATVGTVIGVFMTADGGLVAIAGSWVAVSTVAGAWSVLRLRVIVGFLRADGRLSSGAGT